MRLPRIIMGCGHSTFNLIEEGMACGPRQRMHDPRSKNDLLIDDSNDPSTKQFLLKDGANTSHTRNPSSESVVMKEPLLMRVEIEKGVINKCERGTDDDDECRDDDFGRRISDGNWIGSPSFREYCVDDSDSDHDAVNQGSGNKEGTKKKTQELDHLEYDGPVCILAGAKRLEKKESRGRKFTKVFPTPKNLWHVATRSNHHISSDKLPAKENFKFRSIRD